MVDSSSRPEVIRTRSPFIRRGPASATVGSREQCTSYGDSRGSRNRTIGIDSVTVYHHVLHREGKLANEVRQRNYESECFPAEGLRIKKVKPHERGPDVWKPRHIPGDPWSY